MNPIVRCTLRALSVGALLVATVAQPGAQQPAPARAQGMTAIRLGAIDLGAEIDGMEGRLFRMSLVTIAPGGGTALHDHVDRPEIVYVLRGRITEHAGGVTREYGHGEAFTATRRTSHRLENRGDGPATYVAAVIVREP
ncbi:MAG: cupin domain-containing protein [Burkholderiales bacterium]|nr:cupin domain-containing protein [Burkholderiales bacterium]